MNEYTLLETIGYGSFSVVKKALHVPSSTFFAIKIVTPEESNDSAHEGDHLLAYDRKRIKRETRIWESLKHPNICHLIRVIEEDGKVAFVMDYAEGGDLLQALMEGKQELDACEIFFQLCSAVLYMHNLGLVHGDIKLENILLAGGSKVLLSDFGLARHPPDDQLINCGTIEYAAPELISAEHGEDPFKSDIWALGVVLYALVYKQLPFDGPSAKVMKARILHHEPSFGPAQEDVVDLLRGLLHKDPQKRAGFLEIFDSQFFKLYTNKK